MSVAMHLRGCQAPLKRYALVCKSAWSPTTDQARIYIHISILENQRAFMGIDPALVWRIYSVLTDTLSR